MDWINNLTPQAAQFWGAIIGVGGGLTAILIGALFNASLNRRRDDRLRDMAGRSVAAALRGELNSLRQEIQSLTLSWERGVAHFSNLNDEESKKIIDAREFTQLPTTHTLLYEANASELGLLGSNLSGAVTIVYSNYRARVEVFSRPFKMRMGDLEKEFSEQIKWGNRFCKDCGDIENFLYEFEQTGKSLTMVKEALAFLTDQRQRTAPASH